MLKQCMMQRQTVHKLGHSLQFKGRSVIMTARVQSPENGHDRSRGEIHKAAPQRLSSVGPLTEAENVAREI